MDFRIWCRSDLAAMAVEIPFELCDAEGVLV